MRAVALLAVVLAAGVAACAIPRGRPQIPPHLEPVLPADVPKDRPRLGVLRFVDARPASGRRSFVPPLRAGVWGFKREGEEQAGDDRFAEPIGPAFRRDAIATLLRSGAFASVTPVDTASEGEQADLLLAGTLEAFLGIRFGSTSWDLLRLGWFRSRSDDPIGVSRVHFRLYAAGEVVWDDRIETWHKSHGESPERAALDAMAMTNETLAHRLFRHLQPSRAQLRDLPLRVLDGCALGAETVARRVSDASEILEREADLRLVAQSETWLPPSELDSTLELLEHVRGLDPAEGGALVAFVPQRREAKDFGLARQLGEHLVVRCRADEPANPTTLAHEVAHLLGAIHVRDRASLLNPTAEFDARFLDLLNRRILRLTRGRAFGRPLAPGTRDEVEALYRAAPAEVVLPADLERALAPLREAGDS